MLIKPGIKYIIIASVLYTLMGVIVKYLDKIPAIEIVFFRSIVSMFLAWIHIKKYKLSIFNESTPLLLLRGLFGAIGLIIFFYNIGQIPLGVATSILYLSPIFTVILAIFIVKEYPQKKQIPFMLLCFAGVLLIKNFDARVPIKFLVIGVIGSIFAGAAYNMIRLLKDKVHHQVIIFYFPLVCIPICLIFLPSLWVTPSLKELFLLLLVGVITQLAQVYMTMAYQLEKASRISHFNFLNCIFSFGLGIILFNEYISLYSLLGLACLFIGIKYTSKFSH